MKLLQSVSGKIGSMTLCGRLDAILVVLALVITLLAAFLTGNPAWLKLAGAVVFVACLGLGFEVLGVIINREEDENGGHSNAR